MIVAQVTQFFDFKGMTWDELVKSKNNPVCLTDDKKCCLWHETPIMKEVSRKDAPTIGNIWLAKTGSGAIKVYKTNFDTSD